MFEEYDKKINKLLFGKYGGTNWNEILSDHKEKIKQIQHERLIHLLVTIFVGGSMLLTSLASIISPSTYLMYICLPLILLFLAYIFHYYRLENMTQSWYKLEDKIKELIHD